MGTVDERRAKITDRKEYIAKQLGIDPNSITSYVRKNLGVGYKFKGKTEKGYNFYSVKTNFGVDFVTEIYMRKDEALV